VVHQVDRPLAHHSHLGLGLLALLEDDGAACEELDLDPLGQLLQDLLIDVAERIVRLEELSDVMHQLES